MKLVIFFVVIISIHSIYASCPPNSERKSIGSSNCYQPVPTCENPSPQYISEPSGYCLEDLKSACWCNDGYLMNNNNQCVLKENCSKP